MSSIGKAVKEMSRSEGWQEKISKYDVFYHMCEKCIVNIFDSREEAVEYLLDMEYLQRENEHKSKNILWNCFGDLVYKNICNNLCYENVKQRKKHYETGIAAIRNAEEKAVEIIKSIPDNSVEIYQEEMDWLEHLSYRRGCRLDRELLYILLVLSKRNSGKFKIYMNQKKRITCNTIDKWLGDGVCICKNGLMRLQKAGLISVDIVKRKHYEIEIHKPEFETKRVAFSASQKNPLVDFYKYNGERRVESCVVCGREFIKIGNTMTCGVNCSRENRKRNNHKCSA